MKHLIYGLAIIGSCLGVVSCDESDYDLNEIVPQESYKILYIRDNGEQEVSLLNTGEKQSYTFTVIKGGSDPSLTAEADIRLMSQSEVDEQYGDIDGSDYRIIPAESYTLPESLHINIGTDEEYQTFTVSLDAALIKEAMDKKPEAKYVLPLKLVSETDRVNQDKSELVMNFVIQTPQITFTTNLYEQNVYTTYTLSVGATLQNLEKNEAEVSCLVDTGDDIDLITYIYNQENGKTYEPFPASTNLQFTNGNKMVFASGTMDSTVELLINANGLEEDVDYLLPLRLTADEGTGTFELSEDYYYVIISSGLPRIYLEEDQVTSPYSYHNTSSKDGQGTSALIDDDEKTYWHGEYDGNEEYYNPNDTYGQYIDVALKEPINIMQFFYKTRYNASVCIQKLTIYTSTDGENWTELKTFTEEIDQLPQGMGSEYTSPILESDTSYSYIRFSVTKAGDYDIPYRYQNSSNEWKQSFFALSTLTFWGD